MAGIRDITEDANKTLQESDLPVFQDKCRERAEDRANAPYVTSSVQEIAQEKGVPPILQIDLVPESTFRNTSNTSNTSNERGDTAATAQETLSDFPEAPLIIAGPLRHIQYSQITSRSTLIEQLLKTIPLNECGLPLYLYRPDLLDYTQFQSLPSQETVSDLQESLLSAMVHISYAQGFPSLSNGEPLWAQFDWESIENYIQFTEYLEQEGIRSLHTLREASTHMSVLTTSTSEFYEVFTLYSWAFRARAFDLYQTAHKQRKRIERVMNTEDSHFELAEKMMKKVSQRISEFTDDDWEIVDPITATKMLSELTKVQRISIGLPANGPQTKDAAPPFLSTEQQMKRLAQAGDIPEVGANNKRIVTQEDKSSIGGPSSSTNFGLPYEVSVNDAPQEFDLLRDRPDLVDEAQDLILRLMRGPQQQQTPPQSETIKADTSDTGEDT